MDDGHSLVDAGLIALLLKVAPELASIAKEVGYDITKAKKDDLILLCLIDHNKMATASIKSMNEVLCYIREKVDKLDSRSINRFGYP